MTSDRSAKQFEWGRPFLMMPLYGCNPYAEDTDPTGRRPFQLSGTSHLAAAPVVRSVDRWEQECSRGGEGRDDAPAALARRKLHPFGHLYPEAMPRQSRFTQTPVPRSSEAPT